MKKFAIATVAAALLSTSALAADLGVISQPAPAGFVPANNWTGFYAGIFGSIGASDIEMNPVGVPGAGFLISGRGALGGVQIGADYQLDSFVLGAVADIALSGVESKASFGGAAGFEYISRLEYLGTVRARAGFVPMDDLLIYAHGGFAYGRSTPTVLGGGVAAPGFVATNRTGWTIGAGLEYKVTSNISVQTEYAYTDLGAPTVTDATVLPASATESLKLHTVKAGLNFRF